MEERFMKYINKTDACWLWTATAKSRYGLFWINGKYKPAHRVSYELWNGNIPDGLVVRHSCDVPKCVNPNHLIVGTTQDNVNDKMERGRYVKVVGKQVGTSKINDDIAKEILIYHNFGFSQTQIARLIDNIISQQTISHIIRGNTWKHIHL